MNQRTSFFLKDLQIRIKKSVPVRSVIHSMERRGRIMIISVWGTERRMEEARHLLRQRHCCIPISELSDFDLSKIDVILLPTHGIQGSKGNYMNKKLLPLPDDFWECLRDDCLIICGQPNAFLNSRPQPKKYYLSDERYLAVNSRLTAQGTLYFVLDQADRILTEMTVDIMGKGHCGIEIGELLRGLGMNVRYIRHAQASKSKNEYTLQDYKQMTPGDFVIICTPVPVLDEDIVKSWNRQVRIIDISGVHKDDERLRSHPFTYIRAGNLPEQFCWKTSGKAIYEFAERVMKE